MVALTLADAGYYLPYGGATPGPRFLAASIPFLCLGLPFALERFRKTVLALVLVSVVLTTGNAVTWGVRDEHDRWYPGHGVSDLAKTVWVWSRRRPGRRRGDRAPLRARRLRVCVARLT